MKPMIRAILEDCIERGIQDGIRRAGKHDENPSDAALTDHIESGIWLHIDEYFSFDGEM